MIGFVTAPRWIALPDASALSLHYPTAAKAAKIGGRAVLECDVKADGWLAGCKVRKEDPAGYGFGEAGLALSGYFRTEPSFDDHGAPRTGRRIVVPITFVP